MKQLEAILITAAVALWIPVVCSAFHMTSSGDLSFVADVTSFPLAGDSMRCEVYIEVLDSEIEFEERDGGQEEAKLSFTVTLRDAEGDAIEDQREVEIKRSGDQLSGALSSEVFELVYILSPGRYTVRVEVVDEYARKFSIAGHLGSKRKGAVTGRISFHGVDHSGIMFAKAVKDAESPTDRFLKGDKVVVPNPRRLYGKRLPELLFYLESASVEDLSGRLSRNTDEWLVPVGCTDRGCFGSLDITGFAPGRYSLELLGSESSNRVAQASFDIAWSDDIWDGRQDEIVTSLVWLAGEDEISRMKLLSPGEKERYLIQFWRRLDPDTSTEFNEIKEKYLARVEHADRYYGSGSRRGAYTDRGRIYIRYGPPDEIVDRPESSAGFMAKEFLDVDLDPEESLDREAADRPSINDPMKSYQIWKYDDRGDPLPTVKKLSSGIGMKFIFTDRGGFGDYELTYSSEMGEY
jgi:GWxTD domain-containing protein